MDDFPENPASVQPLLSAVFAHLERGERDAAYRVLGMLRLYKPEVLKASPAGAQAAELLALSRPRGIRCVLGRPGEMVAGVAGSGSEARAAPPPRDHIEIPLIPSIPQLGATIGRAAQQSDAPERARGIRRLAHAARWEPAMLVELVELFGSLGPLQLNNLAGELPRVCHRRLRAGQRQRSAQAASAVLHGRLRVYRLSAERKGPGGASRVSDVAAIRRCHFSNRFAARRRGRVEYGNGD